MSQHVKEKAEPTRVPLGAFVDRSQRDQLAAIAQRDDRSVSSIVRLALAGFLERELEVERG
jgi:predicted transcriptional regulator